MKLKKWRNSDANYSKFFFSVEISKLVLSSLISSYGLSHEDSLFLSKCFFSFSKFYCISFYSSSCVYSGFSSSVFQLFKMSSHVVKRNFSYGLLMGVSKSSF